MLNYFNQYLSLKTCFLDSGSSGLSNVDHRTRDWLSNLTTRKEKLQETFIFLRTRVLHQNGYHLGEKVFTEFYPLSSLGLSEELHGHLDNADGYLSIIRYLDLNT